MLCGASAQEGPSPTWSESIFLPFVPPRNDFSPNNLKAMRDELYLNLFDEVIVEGETNDYRTEDLTFQRREKRYLGRVAIPFSTIYLNGRIEGLFRLETPAVNLGYAYRNRGAVVEGIFFTAYSLMTYGQRLQVTEENSGERLLRRMTLCVMKRQTQPTCTLWPL